MRPLERLQSQALEPADVGLGEGLVGEVFERPATPEGERAAQ
jgi:hypothetical protein